MMSHYFTIFLVLCASNLVYSANLWDLSAACSPASSDYAECTKNALQQTWPTIVSGFFVDIPSLDPLSIEDTVMPIQFGPLQGSYDWTNIQVRGFLNTTFLTVNPQISDGNIRVELQMYVPTLIVEANYEGKGGSGPYSINRAKGHIVSTMTDLIVTAIVDGPVENDKWVIQSADITPELGSLEISATDTVPASKSFIQIALAFINDNWENFYKGGLPALRDQLDNSVSSAVNNVFDSISASEFFGQPPDSDSEE